MQAPNLTIICALYVPVCSDFADKECCFQLLLMQGVDSTHTESARCNGSNIIYVFVVDYKPYGKKSSDLPAQVDDGRKKTALRVLILILIMHSLPGALGAHSNYSIPQVCLKFFNLIIRKT